MKVRKSTVEDGQVEEVNVEIYGMLEKAIFIEKKELLKMNVRYVTTDMELSQYDIYEHNETGTYYATTL